jgi:hypothetical protein
VSSAPTRLTLIIDSATAAKSYELEATSPDELTYWLEHLQTAIDSQIAKTARASGDATWAFRIEQTIPVISSQGKSFTAYMVDATAPDGTTRTLLKRYRQFDDLDAVMRRIYPARDVPPLPSKKLVGNMNAQFVRTRW